MVLPTNLNPRRFKSLLMASDSGVFAGNFLHRLPGVLLRLVADKSPDVLVKRAEFVLHGQETFAFWMAASIFSRLRTIPASASKLFRFFWPYLATMAGSNWSKASR